MTELICPFCGKPLLACIYNQNDIIYCCDNKDCVYYDDADNQNAKHYLATPEFWQALIETKKKLDLAIDELEDCEEWFMGSKVEKHFMLERIYKTYNCIEQINQKEQQ